MVKVSSRSPSCVAAETSDDRPSAGFQIRPHHCSELPSIRDVDLVEHDDARPIGEPAVGLELALDHVDVGDRVPARLHRCAVDDVHQHAAAFDVAKELVPETATRTGPLDQAGNVSHCESHVTGLDHPEVRDQRGEGIVGDLGAGRRDGRHQARLARAG